MNKLVLLLGVIGSSAAFSPITIGRAHTKLGSEATLATYPPLTIGGEAAASISDVHPTFNMEPSIGSGLGGLVQPDMQGQLGPVSLSAIRAQQSDTGLHAASSQYDYTRNCMRH